MRWGTERQIIKALEARLQWFMNEADPDEFDSEEITAIVDLLQIMDPIERREGDFYVADKGLGRFWAFYVFRKMYQRPEKDEPAYPLGLRIEMRLRHIFRSNVVVNGAFIVALVVAMILGGTAVVYAQREGIFNVIVDNQDKVVVLTAPSTSNDQRFYENMESVPIKYVSCLWTPTDIPEDLALDVIRITEEAIAIEAKCEFKSKDTKQFITVTKNNFKEAIVLTDQLYDGFSFYRKETYDSIEVEYLMKENDDYTEYIALFENKNSTYVFSSNLEFDDIKNIIQKNIIDKNL